MRKITLFGCLLLSGCAMDAVTVKWHDGKIIRIDGGAESLVTVKLDGGTLTVDNRKTSAIQSIVEFMMLKMMSDTEIKAK